METSTDEVTRLLQGQHNSAPLDAGEHDRWKSGPPSPVSLLCPVRRVIAGFP
jgi:hypothetical protein